jgi:hypothetical protein
MCWLFSSFGAPCWGVHPASRHGGVMLASGFSLGWDTFVAIGTLGLAAGTVWLAWLTRKLAVASRDDERAQWRPVISPGRTAPVEYDDTTGAMGFEIRNVGRGPAFGLNAQIRSGRRALGASNPSGVDLTTVALAPGESEELRCRITEPSQSIRGLGIEAEIYYYDITERWHRSIFRISGRKSPDKLTDPSVVPDLAVASAFVYETDRHLLPVGGSPGAIERAARQQRSWRNRGKQLAARVKQLVGRLRRRSSE